MIGMAGSRQAMTISFDFTEAYRRQAIIHTAHGGGLLEENFPNYPVDTTSPNM
jgi:hypothetical protein